eukprot:scaffold52584_cov63-Phaeocystis_antarctica.AAC.2
MPRYALKARRGAGAASSPAAPSPPLGHWTRGKSRRVGRRTGDVGCLAAPPPLFKARPKRVSSRTRPAWDPALLC